MKKILLPLITFALLLTITGHAGASILTLPDARVWIDPPSKTVLHGDPFSLNIETEILSLDLFTAGIGLSYDPSILSFTGATEGGFLGGVPCIIPDCAFEFTEPANGTIEIFNSLLISGINGATGSGTLATLTFNAIGLGTSAISFNFADFFDSTLPPPDGNGPNILHVHSTNGLVNVAVPEPATLLLLGSGLVALGANRLKRKINKKI